MSSPHRGAHERDGLGRPYPGGRNSDLPVRSVKASKAEDARSLDAPRIEDVMYEHMVDAVYEEMAHYTRERYVAATTRHGTPSMFRFGCRCTACRGCVGQLPNPRGAW